MAVKLLKKKVGSQRDLYVRAPDGTAMRDLVMPIIRKLHKNPKYLDDVKTIRVELLDMRGGSRVYYYIGTLTKGRVKATANAMKRKR
jgi:hypothetical protein